MSPLQRKPAVDKGGYRVLHCKILIARQDVCSGVVEVASRRKLGALQVLQQSVNAMINELGQPIWKLHANERLEIPYAE